MKLKWLDRSLVIGPHLVLVTSEKEFNTVLSSVGLKESVNWIGKTAVATTTSFKVGNKDYCVVSINPEIVKDLDPVDVATVLVHEAVHVFQQHCKNAGEDVPSEEFEAYSIQHISQQLMVAYRNTLTK